LQRGATDGQILFQCLDSRIVPRGGVEQLLADGQLPLLGMSPGDGDGLPDLAFGLLGILDRVADGGAKLRDVGHISAQRAGHFGIGPGLDQPPRRQMPAAALDQCRNQPAYKFSPGWIGPEIGLAGQAECLIQPSGG
jgi:hypothetical protein